MKRKTVLRLLAVAMAASLATTSIPGTALTRTEIVYADEFQLETGVKAASYNSITVEAVNGSQYLAVAADSSEGTPTKETSGWVSATGDDSAGYTAVLPNLTPGKSYTIYTLTGETVSDQTITQSTKKIDLSTDLSDVTITLSSDTFVYDGTAKTPTIETITVGGVTLISGTDYDLSYTNNTDVSGEHKVTITGKGDKCEKSKDETFTITAASIENATVTLNTKGVSQGYSVTYDGTAQSDPTVAVTVGGRTLTSGSDFEATCTGDKTKAGTVSVTITGKGNYTGTVKSTNIPAYTITKDTAKATAPTLSVTNDSVTATGFGVTIDNYAAKYTYEYAIVKSSESAPTDDDYTELESSTFTSSGTLDSAADYTVYCRVKNTDDHAASDVTKLAVTTATAKSANIESVSATQIVMSGATDDAKYIATTSTTLPAYGDGTGWVTAAGSKATFDNLDPGTTYHIFKQDDNTEVATQTTERASLSGATVVIEDNGSDKGTGEYSSEYTGVAQKPTVKVTVGGKDLTLNDDYTVAYENNTNVGTNATVIVTGTGKYKDSPTSEFTFTIAAANIEDATVTIGEKDKDAGYSSKYNGKEQKPKVTVNLGGAADLVEDTDYEVTYSNNTNVGTAGVSIAAKSGSNYTGTVKTANVPAFTITEDTTPDVPTLSQGSVTDKSVTVVITDAKAGYNYEYAYLTAAEITANAEPNYGATSVAGSASETSFTIDNLTPGTDYTVYCRVKASGNNSVSEATELPVKTTAEALLDDKVTVTESAEYNGQNNAPTVTVKNSADETITNTDDKTYYTVKYYKQDENGDNGAEVTAPKAAGKYNVVVTGDGTNYSGTITKVYTITQKEVTATATEVKDKDYDGNEFVKVTATFDNKMILGDDVVTIPTLQGTLDKSDAGTDIELKTVSTDNVVLGGADAANYKLTSVATGKLTATINPQSNVTFSGTSTYTVAVGQTITLDTENNVGANMTYTLVNNDGETVTDSAITVGTGTVTLNSYLDRTDLKIKVEISDDGGENYDASNVSKLISLNLTRKAPYFKLTGSTGWDSATKKLVINTVSEDAFTSALTAKLYYVTDNNATDQGEAELSGKTITYTYNGSKDFPSAEGTYTVVIGYTPTGDDINNIEEASETITLVIATAKKELSITVDNKSYTVGGTVPTYTYKATTDDGSNSVTLSKAPVYTICETGTNTPVELNSSTKTGTYDIVATFTLDDAEKALYTLTNNVVRGKLTVSPASTYNPASGTDKTDTDTSTTTQPTLTTNEDGEKIIVDADGKVIANELVTTSDGKSYVTDEDGVILTSKIAEVGDVKVYVGKNGVVATDKAVTYEGKKYYATETGEIATNGFVTTARGNKVYATKTGALKTSTAFTVKGKKYYAKASGVIATTGFVKTAKGNTVYATKSGALKVNTAFKASNGKKYVADKNGKIVKGKKITIGNKVYTTNKKGVIVKVTTKKR